MPGQRRWPGHVCERQGQHGALRSVGESGGAERLRPQLLQLPLELHPAVLKPGLDLGEGEKTRLVTMPPRFDYPVVGSRAVAIPRARAAAAAPLTCTSERRILPASCRRSAAPRYCCRWKELSRVLICSALNAVRSRRPPRPHGSSGPAHSGPSSGTAPDGLPPAPGHRDKEEERRVSQARAPRGEPPPPPPRAATAQWRLPGKAGSAPDPPRPAREPRLSRGTCGGSGRPALPAPAACPVPVPRARRPLRAPLALAEAGAGAGPVARGRCSVWGALGGALESLAALGQPFHGERGLSHRASFRRCREGGTEHGPLLYSATPGGKRCLCKYTSKGQISII